MNRWPQTQTTGVPTLRRMRARVDRPGAGVPWTASDRPLDLMVVVATVFAGAVLLGSVASGPEGDREFLDLVVGLVCCVALCWRRRHPVGVAVGVLLASSVVVSAGAASLVALFGVAVHRRLGAALAVALANVAASMVLWLVYPDGEPFALILSFAVLLCLGTVAWGAFVRARHQLVQGALERADWAVAEQRLRAEHARRSERSRIAREMHDVVAHRVSLVALHAGGLQVRPDLPPDQVRATAGLIRASAQDALDELRAVVGVLREGDQGLDAPQHGIGDIARLVEESVQAGATVSLHLEVPEASQAPAALGRDAYRIVQEALTNVHKHAAGTSTRVTVRGGPGDGLHVSVRNRLPLAVGPAPMTGAGAGLVGLTERVALSGGELAHGRTGDGDFLVEADLTWPR